MHGQDCLCIVIATLISIRLRSIPTCAESSGCMGRFNDGVAAEAQKLEAGEDAEDSYLDDTANQQDENDIFEDSHNQMDWQEDMENQTEEEKERDAFVNEAVAGKLRCVSGGCHCRFAATYDDQC